MYGANLSFCFCSDGVITTSSIEDVEDFSFSLVSSFTVMEQSMPSMRSCVSLRAGIIGDGRIILDEYGLLRPESG